MGATIKDVAKLAGTSTATVSKVMNGSYSISQETADKVRKAMEELQTVDKTLLVSTPEAFFLFSVQKVCT